MDRKAIQIVTVIVIAVAGALCCGAEKAADEAGLKVYLPRQVVIKDSAIRLDAVAIVRGEQSLVDQAGRLGLGVVAVPGQAVVIDRTTILSRLAGIGIMASEVELSGAERVSVKRQEKIIRGQNLIQTAKDFLSANPPIAGPCEWQAVGTVQDVIIYEADEDVNLVPRFVASSQRQVKVAVVVMSGGREIAVREVTFNVIYEVRQAVTAVDIPQGGTITPQNTKIETLKVSYPQPEQAGLPYGLVAKRALAANSVIRPAAVSPVVSPVIVKRDRDVAMEIRAGVLIVRAMGQALQDGRAGEYIKVRNADSRRIITAKVNEDGTVRPVF